MSYLFYDKSEEGNAQYTLYSELPFDTDISPLIRQLFKHEDLKDIEYRRYVVDAMEISYLRVALIGSFEHGPNVFDYVFPVQFLNERLSEFRMASGTAVRSGSRGSFSPIASSSAVRISQVHNECAKYHRNLANCRLDFEANGRVCETKEFVRLANQYDLNGGSWLIHARNYKDQRTDENGRPKRVQIPDDRVRKAAIASFLSMVELVKDGRISPDYVKALRWIRIDNGSNGINYVTKILNTDSSYLRNFLEYRTNKRELWYFNMDTQVSQIYRIIQNDCVNPLFQSASYKAEVISACNMNRRNATDSTILCFYPSLNHKLMMITDQEDLEDECAVITENVARFGDLKTPHPMRNGFGNRKVLR